LKFLCFLLSLCAPFILWGQNPYHQFIDMSTGLPSNQVYDIFQDSKGFMWFATGKGICRYDGLNSKTFLAENQSTLSGSCISEDRLGRIWYVSFDGFLHYVENGVLKSLNQPTSLGYYRFGILENELYVIQPTSVIVYDLMSLKIKKRHVLKDVNVKFCAASKERFYVLADSLHEFSVKDGYKKYEVPLKVQNEIKTPILNFWDQKLVINSKSNSTIFVFDKGVFTKSEMNTKLDFIQNTSVIEDDIWICSSNGVRSFHLKTKEQRSYFENLNISYVFKDLHQNYWISTLNKGVLFFEDFEKKHIDLNFKPIEMVMHKNQIYIGTEKKLDL